MARNIYVKAPAQLQAQAEKAVGDMLEGAIKETIGEVVQELPRGQNSKIAKELTAVRVSSHEFSIYASMTWVWLNDGTGVFNPKHEGRGPEGQIIPIRAKALHFKNGELARALGFPDENVFLKSVKGIHGRFFWDRHFTAEGLQEKMAQG